MFHTHFEDGSYLIARKSFISSWKRVNLQLPRKLKTHFLIMREWIKKKLTSQNRQWTWCFHYNQITMLCTEKKKKNRHLAQWVGHCLGHLQTASGFKSSSASISSFLLMPHHGKQIVSEDSTGSQLFHRSLDWVAVSHPWLLWASEERISRWAISLFVCLCLPSKSINNFIYFKEKYTNHEVERSILGSFVYLFTYFWWCLRS